MKTRYIKTSAIWALILLGLFILFQKWIPVKGALLLTIAIPFLYFVPGFFITKILFPSRLDYIETISLAILFSLMLSHMSIYTVEETTRRMTIRDIALVMALINILCALMYLAHRKRLLPARRQNKFSTQTHRDR